MLSSPPKSSKPSAARLLSSAAAAAAAYLDAYGAFVFGFKPARHHAIWLKALTALVEGRSPRRRLLLIAPPGSGKTTWLSHIFVCWYLGRFPDKSVLFLTSSDTNARQYGSVVKSVLEGNARHQLAFAAPGARPDRARGWSTDGLYLQATPGKDPAYRSLGFGASVIGARADVLLMDDPMTQEQSQSEVEQARGARYLDATLLSRLQPDGLAIMVTQRWAEGDLAGHVRARDEWQVIHLPAISDAGESIWHEHYSIEWLRAMQREIGGPLFAAVWQGDPTALGGVIFQSSEWFQPLPDDLQLGCTAVLQYWDLAYTSKQTSDYSVGLTLALERVPDQQPRFVIANVYRRRLSEQELFEAMVEQIVLSRPTLVGIEDAAYRTVATADLVRRLNAELERRGQYCHVMAVKVTTDKVARARLPAARAEAGMVYADRQASWFPTFAAECTAFPLGKHDDQVDALSGAFTLAITKLGSPPRSDDAPEHEEYAWQKGPDLEKQLKRSVNAGLVGRTEIDL